MTGQWKIASQDIGGEKRYAVVRVKDTSKPEHGGNREYLTVYTDRRDLCESICEKASSIIVFSGEEARLLVPEFKKKGEFIERE
ncbi:hypothetical protein FACS1894120_5190 [Clostridia bacterium]|nr:hypothetical protein FACS1894120_5190 [Clostridia bacterium]